jgi:rod shape-determining protein MreD
MIMSWLKFILGTYVVFVLQSTIASSLAVAGFAPNLVLAGLVVMSGHLSRRHGLLAAALWGFLADSLTEGRLGAGILGFSLSAWAIQTCSAGQNGGVHWKLAVLSVPLVWGNIVGMAVLRSLSDGSPFDLRGLCIHAAGSAFYTAGIIAVVQMAHRFVRGSSSSAEPISAPTVSNKWRMLTE